MAKKRKKPKMEFRYYQMPAGSPILALLGQKGMELWRLVRLKCGFREENLR